MSLGNALGYLTILPIPYKKHIPLVHSIHYFPLVGGAMGGLGVIFFLSARWLFPAGISCVLTVVFLEFINGGLQLRGFGEMIQGRQTFPGHGFDSDFRWEKPSLTSVIFLLLIKAILLISLSDEWQIRSVFLLPILGRCAQTMAFVLSPQRLTDSSIRNSTGGRRRIRAGFLSATSLFLMFLFPWRAGLPSLALFLMIVLGGLKHFNKRHGGLTLQTVSFLSEIAEMAILIALAISWQVLRV